MAPLRVLQPSHHRKRPATLPNGRRRVRGVATVSQPMVSAMCALLPSHSTSACDSHWTVRNSVEMLCSGGIGRYWTVLIVLFTLFVLSMSSIFVHICPYVSICVHICLFVCLLSSSYAKTKHVQHWMTSIGLCQDLLLECQFIQKEFLPLARLVETTQDLRTSWAKALTRNHLLTSTLREHLEELVVRDFKQDV